MLYANTYTSAGAESDPTPTSANADTSSANSDATSSNADP
jgi:hypothetical protein